MAAEEIMLDVCDLEPPEPYELATAASLGLEPGQYVRMISRRRPQLLYPWLSERGFCAETRKHEDELFEIFIWAESDEETGKAIPTIE